MKQNVNPAVAAVVIIIVVAVAAALIWKGVGPRTDGPSKPVDMSNVMGKHPSAAAPYSGGGANR